MLNSAMLVGVALEVTLRRGAGFARDPVTATGLASIHLPRTSVNSANFAITEF
jgi:hypothetical protein